MLQFVRTLLPLLAFGAVLVCGCQRRAEPPAVVAPPAVVVQPEAPPVIPPEVELAPEPRPFRPKYGHVKSIFFLTSIKPEAGTVAASKGFVLSYGLTYRDLDAISALPGVAELIPVRFVPAEVKHDDRIVKVRIAATTEGYADVYAMRLSAGRFLTPADDTELDNYCVLKPALAKKLFGTEDPLGQTVSARGHFFKVVGVLARDTEENDPSMYVPFKTARRRFGDIISVHTDGKRVNEKVDLHEIIVRATDPDKRENLAGSVRELLDKAHVIKDWQVLWPE